jgi:hypothetical protein
MLRRELMQRKTAKNKHQTFETLQHQKQAQETKEHGTRKSKHNAKAHLVSEVIESWNSPRFAS